MEIFFSPKSVAVVGASNSPSNLGASICKILEYNKYDGKVYPINKNGEDINDYPGYSTVLSIPGDVDLAIVLTPAKVVPSIVRQCGLKGIKRIIIESAGFSEIGEEGKRIQEQMDRARKAGYRMRMDPNYASGPAPLGEYKIVLMVGDQEFTQYASILKDHWY